MATNSGSGPTPTSPRRGLLAFLLLAFGISWALWVPLWLLGVPPASGVAQTALIAGFFGPAIAAIVVRLLVTREGFADAGLRPNLRRGWMYYVAAILWPLPVVGAVVGLVAVLGLGPINVSAAGDVTSVAGLILSAAVWTPFFFAEEFGWRGYLQIRVFADRPLQAALATGVIWGVWHFPAALAGLIPNGHGLLSLALLPWYQIWLSIVLGWLRTRTGSVWTACLAHAANNNLLAPLGAIVGLTAGMGDLLLSPTGVLLLIPVGVLCGWIVWSGGLKPMGSGSKPSAGAQVRAG